MQPLKAPQTHFDKSRSATPISRAEGKLTPPNLDVRPNTSDGPGDSNTMMFHMKTNTTAFQSQEHVPWNPSPMQSSTTLSPAYVREEQGVIGMALGSPTVGSRWNLTTQASTPTTAPHEPSNQMPPIAYPYGASGGRELPPKPKLSRWKSLFRKAAPPPPHSREKASFYQLTQTATAAAHRADSHHDGESHAPREPLKHVVEAMRTASPPIYRSDIRASRKEAPEGFIAPRSPPETPITRRRALTLGDTTTNIHSATTIQRAFTAPISPWRVIYDGAPAVPQLTITKSTSDHLHSSQKPLLDINIPDVKMDRYSVMFGNLLQSSSNRSSSLLIRRQGNAEKLKPLNELSAKVCDT
jgi:hypothetical protein